MYSIICKSAEELEAALLQFNLQLGGTTGIKPKGAKTLGGITNAPKAFKDMCTTAFDGMSDMSPTVDEICCRAALLAKGIVSKHIFDDGNGRTSMYSIYLFCACCKFKFSANTVALHTFMFGTAQRDKVPSNLEHKIADFMTAAEEKELRSHLSHVKIKLNNLQDARKEAKKWVDGQSINTTPSLLKHPTAAFAHADLNALTINKDFTLAVQDLIAAKEKSRLHFQAKNKACDDIRKNWKYEEAFPTESVANWIMAFYSKHHGDDKKFPTYEDYVSSQTN